MSPRSGSSKRPPPATRRRRADLDAPRQRFAHFLVNMRQHLGLVAVVVRDYEEALHFYCNTLDFTVVEDRPVPEQNKRFVIIAPPGARESRVLLARAATAEQETRIGNQTGGRVFLFLYTDDFWRDYERYRARGVEFVRPPREEPYGTVAVFRDLYGTLWDLVEPSASAP